MEKNNIQPEGFKDRIIFMSMYNDIIGDKKKQPRNVSEEFLKCCCVRYNVSQRTLVTHSSDLDLKNNGTVRSLTNQTVHETELLNS